MKTAYLISRLIDGAEYYREGNITRSKIQTAYEELIIGHDKEIESTINSLQQQVNKVLDIYFRVRKEGLLEEMRRLERISDELKQKIGR